MMIDLTRWNRAGLSRFDYLDANAAECLEHLRASLAARFPEWRPVEPAVPGIDTETEEARKQRLEALYQADPDDLLWQLTRQFARACHVLGGHIDAYANEAYLGTASQWDNLRRLVALLDYAPRPPASASAPLVLLLKDGKSGTIEAGLQVKHSPASGSPVVFETLQDLAADAGWNIIHARDHQRNPIALQGRFLVLEGHHDKLKSGEPLLLEDERDGRLSAHLVEGILLGTGSTGAEITTVSVSPTLPSGFAGGWTRVHVQPKDKLHPIGPAATGVDHAGHSLQLAVSTDDLAAGDIVVIRSGDDKPRYRRTKAVHATRLVFHREIGQLTLTGATVARPVTVPLSDLANPPDRREIESDGTVVDVVYAAGDWSRLAGEWLADIRKIGPREYLPAYFCLHAKYVPVTKDDARVADDERPGYTALTLTWHADTDDVPGSTDLRLSNPQALLAPPPGPGPWPVDRFLNESDHHRLQRDLVTSLGKHTSAGDLAVVVKGGQMAWSRLGTVSLDLEHEEATLSAESRWEDRGGGPYFLSVSRVYSHFTGQVRVLDWTVNDTPLTGVRVVPETLPDGLTTGRLLIVDNGGTALETSLANLDPDGEWLELADALPAGTTAGNLMIHGNVVSAGHGETRPQRVLGSGNGTQSNQQFTLAAEDPSFVADAAMSSGVRADLEIEVSGGPRSSTGVSPVTETWVQVSNLKDSGPTDPHYQVRLDQDGQLEVHFGDGRHGRRLPTGSNNIRVRFRQGTGTAGNLPAGSLTQLVRPHSLIDEVAQPLESSGGANRESNEDLRDNAPANLLALDRAVSLEDYTQLARGHASVAQARAFRHPAGLGQREWLELVVMAEGGGTLSTALKSDVQAYLQARAQPGVVVTVSDYERLTFEIQATVRAVTDVHDPQTVMDNVRTALLTAFSEESRQLGQALYRGEVYQVLDGVAGVENSDCTIVLDPVPDGVRVARSGNEILTARPGPGQCLVLAAEESTSVVITVEEYLP
jgi:uncharacterized phage protein gp47/JayE